MRKQILLLIPFVVMFSFSNCENEDLDPQEQTNNVNNKQNSSDEPQKEDQENTKNKETDNGTNPKNTNNEKNVSGNINGYSYVDLGLKSGLMWATVNIGSTKAEYLGSYFSWGETKPKERYSTLDAKWMISTGSNAYYSPTYSKYVYSDGLKTLLIEDDAASVNWGSPWRIPTSKEQKELVEACDWIWVENYNGTGVNGAYGTSKNNANTIFFPAAGRRYDSACNFVGDIGQYWSASVYSTQDAYYLTIGKYDVNANTVNNTLPRHMGMTIRAVSDNIN